jgi:hypothetical protein
LLANLKLPKASNQPCTTIFQIKHNPRQGKEKLLLSVQKKSRNKYKSDTIIRSWYANRVAYGLKRQIAKVKHAYLSRGIKIFKVV